jgi:hypothetical protein
VYFYLKETRLLVKAKIEKIDGTAMTDKDTVGPVNLTLHSLWSQVDVNLHHTPVTKLGGTNYPYKAYLDLLTSYGKICKENQKVSELFYKDGFGDMDSLNLTGGLSSTNVGLLNRRYVLGYGRTAELEGPLYADLFQQDRLMLPNVSIQIKLWPSTDAFRLMSDKSIYKIHIIDISLKMCHVHVVKNIMDSHSEILKDDAALYRIDKLVIKTYSLSAGQQDVCLDNIFNGLVPNKIFVGLINNAA